MTPVYSFPPIEDSDIDTVLSQAEGEFDCYGKPVSACYFWCIGDICRECLSASTVAPQIDVAGGVSPTGGRPAGAIVLDCEDQPTWRDR